ncbi:hypothetical protein HDU87_003049 [Geranomyces variabilis]|uniref:AAA+ ATPase domain-containing protein n=1 Tax=Geranomyces variabilis TaxID=109894 RepID=A0AAD5TLY8_9FUNG|nr:hypothetical protein HDU87_003049 [Geranomyces variabilis]
MSHISAAVNAHFSRADGRPRNIKDLLKICRENLPHDRFEIITEGTSAWVRAREMEKGREIDEADHGELVLESLDLSDAAEADGEGEDTAPKFDELAKLRSPDVARLTRRAARQPLDVAGLLAAIRNSSAAVVARIPAESSVHIKGKDGKIFLRRFGLAVVTPTGTGILKTPIDEDARKSVKAAFAKRRDEMAVFVIPGSGKDVNSVVPEGMEALVGNVFSELTHYSHAVTSDESSTRLPLAEPSAGRSVWSHTLRVAVPPEETPLSVLPLEQYKQDGEDTRLKLTRLARLVAVLAARMRAVLLQLEKEHAVVVEETPSAPEFPLVIAENHRGVRLWLGFNDKHQAVSMLAGVSESLFAQEEEDEDQQDLSPDPALALPTERSRVGEGGPEPRQFLMQQFENGPAADKVKALKEMTPAEIFALGFEGAPEDVEGPAVSSSLAPLPKMDPPFKVPFDVIVEDWTEVEKLIPTYIMDRLRAACDGDLKKVEELKMNVGYPATAFLTDATGPTLLSKPLHQKEINQIESNGRLHFDDLNRAAIPMQFLRISRASVVKGQTQGLTIRFGRVVNGPGYFLTDVIATPKSILILGDPGLGKTTILRQIIGMICQIRPQDWTVVVDRSDEIGGSSNYTHRSFGAAVQFYRVRSSAVDKIILETVRNHTPRTVVVDEIATTAEADAVLLAMRRGCRLIATGHGNLGTLLNDHKHLGALFGHLSVSTIGDAAAEMGEHGLIKTKTERREKCPFDVLVEVVARNKWVIHHNMEHSVDSYIASRPADVDVRYVDSDGYLTRVLKEQHRPQ